MLALGVDAAVAIRRVREAGDAGPADREAGGVVAGLAALLVVQEGGYDLAIDRELVLATLKGCMPEPLAVWIGTDAHGGFPPTGAGRTCSRPKAMARWRRSLRPSHDGRGDLSERR